MSNFSIGLIGAWKFDDVDWKDRFRSLLREHPFIVATGEQPEVFVSSNDISEFDSFPKEYTAKRRIINAARSLLHVRRCDLVVVVNDGSDPRTVEAAFAKRLLESQIVVVIWTPPDVVDTEPDFSVQSKSPWVLSCSGELECVVSLVVTLLRD